MKSLLKRSLYKLGYSITRRNDIGYLQALNKLLGKEDGAVIFDVGAHHGETEKIFSTAFKNSRIYCFEPFESSFAVLERNVNESTRVFKIGFSDTSGSLEFESNLADATNSLLPLERDAANTWSIGDLSAKEKVICQFATIDEFISQNCIKKIDLLKLDVQGAEYKVLFGAKKSLADGIIKIIYMEVIIAPTYVGQWSIERYIKEMRGYGYELYGIYNMFYDNSARLLQADVIFTIY